VNICCQFPILALAIVLTSCDHPESEKLATKPPNGDTLHRIDTSAKPKTKIAFPRSKYKDWDSFWLAFTRSATNKDTVGIKSLTYFPFYQNEEEINPADFVEYFGSQAFDITRDSSSVSVDTSFLPSLTGRKYLHGQIDSLRYLYANGKDFYFARIDSVYQLLAIKTPG
jgi:hypothetical protein